MSIFDAKTQRMENLANYDYTKSVFLCLMEDDHYDAIYKKEHIIKAGFCQCK